LWQRFHSKFGAKKTVRDGILFHSKREADRYVDLQLLQRSGIITGLELQVKFSLDVNGVHIANYFADFRYREKGKTVVEDSKGFRTDVYGIKKKLMKACYGIEILET
jgi:hypothetical protein